MLSEALDDELVRENWEQLINFAGQVLIGEVNPNKALYEEKVENLKKMQGAPKVKAKKSEIIAALTIQPPFKVRNDGNFIFFKQSNRLKSNSGSLNSFNDHFV